MKILIKQFKWVLLLMICSVLSVQSQEITLAGTWETSNGYRLNIDSSGLGSLEVPGLNTKFRIITSNPVFDPSLEPNPETLPDNLPGPINPGVHASAAVSIAIQFASIGQTEAVNYLPVSSLTGQMYIAAGDEKVTLELFHNYSGSHSMYGLEAFNNYGETLKFKFKSTSFTEVNESPGSKCETCEAYIGSWEDTERIIDPNGNEIFDIKLNYISKDGRVSAVLHKGEEWLPMTGFLGNSTSEWSKPITLILDQTNIGGTESISITGILSRYDLNTGATIDGMVVISVATGVNLTYSSVNVRRKIWGLSSTEVDPITFMSESLNFTDNGAANWISGMQVGNSEEKQLLKIAFDTGGSFDWVNSTQCTTSPCPDFEHLQFDPKKSVTFDWIDHQPHEVGWGPWGNAMANTGSDFLYFIDDKQNIISGINKPFKLITEFQNTPQFEEFLWDGGLALPSYSNRSDVSRTTVDNIMIDLLKAGKVSPNKVCVAFSYDRKSGTGDVEIGGWSPEKADLQSKVVLSRKEYKIPSVGYLWTFPLEQVMVGDQTIQISSDAVFGFDTGSSALKGDASKMTEAKNSVIAQHASSGQYPSLNYVMGTREDGSSAKFSLPGWLYVRHIDQGTNAGTNQIQIQTLDGVTDLWVQGTTIMEELYVVFWYDVALSAQNELVLEAGDVWAFNKAGGPEIIVNELPEPQPTPENPMIIYPNPINLSEGELTVRLHSNLAYPLGEVRYYIRNLSNGSTPIVGEAPELNQGINEFKISIANLPKGDYLLDVHSRGSVELGSSRFVVE